MKEEKKVVEMIEVVDADGNVEKKRFHLPKWLNKKTIIAGATAVVVTGITLIILLGLKSDGEDAGEEMERSFDDTYESEGTIIFDDNSTGEETVVEV